MSNINIIIITIVTDVVITIIIIIWIASLASARKSAADATYATTDDEKCGRGQRKLKKNEYYADDSNDEEGNVCDKENYDNEKNKSIKHSKQSKF